MDLLDAFHHLERCGIEVLPSPHAAQQRVNYSRGAVDIEAFFNQPRDDLFDQFLGGALLHDNEHYSSSP